MLSIEGEYCWDRVQGLTVPYKGNYKGSFSSRGLGFRGLGFGVLVNRLSPDSGPSCRVQLSVLVL